MARVGVSRMAHNTHRTELTLTFEKKVLWYNFWNKIQKKQSLDWDSISLVVDSVDQ